MNSIILDVESRSEITVEDIYDIFAQYYLLYEEGKPLDCVLDSYTISRYPGDLSTVNFAAQLPYSRYNQELIDFLVNNISITTYSVSISN